MKEKYSAEERKQHVLGWAQARLDEGKSRDAYARENGISTASLANWTNGDNGVRLTTEEKKLVNQARRVADHQIYSPEDRIRHVMKWTQECLRSPMSTIEYAEMNGIASSTFTRWVNGNGTTFTPAEQEIINQAKQAASHRIHPVEERIKHAVNWAEEGIANGTTMAEYAAAHDLPIGTLNNWTNGNNGVTLTPQQQDVIDQAKQATRRILPVEERIKHVVSWAEEGAARGTTMAEYAATRGLSLEALRSWANGGTNATFTPEQQKTIYQAKQASSQQTPVAERVEHAVSWAEKRIAHGTTLAGYAEENNLPPQTLSNWVNGKFVTFTPEQQKTIDQAKQAGSQRTQAQARPDEDRRAADIASTNSMVAFAAGSRGRKYAWMSPGGAGATSSAAEPPGRAWRTDQSRPERRSQSPRS
ncbi:hypothetical protein ABT336_10445 [Micromonospora sp. NPDC000207]|uniref:hypothetical protein n=1 Tax=Micromonospora sp. NPDC000207 TaxID=3154246 RepID=UPI0033323327